MISELQRREDDLARNQENRGRLAHVSTFASSIGAGTAEIEDAVDFNGALFIEKPVFNYGPEIDVDALRDLLGLGPNDPVELPQCTAHVVDWDVDESNCYRSAWVAVSVVFPSSILITTPVQITWHLSFVGIALKEVDPDG